MKAIFANPARVLCAAVLAMIGTFTLAVWSTGALDAARPTTPEFRTLGEIARLKETCR